MSLYQWNTQLYEKVSNIFPKCWLRGRKGRRILKHASDDELKMYIENVDIYLAAIFVFVSRMFTNLAIIRRYYIEKWTKKKEMNKKEQEISRAEE